MCTTRSCGFRGIGFTHLLIPYPLNILLSPIPYPLPPQEHGTRSNLPPPRKDMGPDTRHQIYPTAPPPPDRMTDICKSINFLELLLRAVTIYGKGNRVNDTNFMIPSEIVDESYFAVTFMKFSGPSPHHLIYAEVNEVLSCVQTKHQ